MWIKPPHTRDPLMNDRIVNEINAALTAKGWRLVDEDADVRVAAHVATNFPRSDCFASLLTLFAPVGA